MLLGLEGTEGWERERVDCEVTVGIIEEGGTVER